MSQPMPSASLRPTILTVPGLGGSGPAHWQTLWEQCLPDTHRVELGNWDRPHRNNWVARLDRDIRSANAPVILVAHSLGCIAAAWWAELSGEAAGTSTVAGALLVAPPDINRADMPDFLASFAPLPTRPLPFPSILAASSDDPWMDMDRARPLAQAWGSRFVPAGPRGHLNAESAIGWWEEGQELLSELTGGLSAASRKIHARPECAGHVGNPPETP